MISISYKIYLNTAEGIQTLNTESNGQLNEK